MDIQQIKDIEKIKQFLDNNYIKDLKYPIELLKWCLKDSMIYGIITESDGLIAIITGRELGIIQEGIKKDILEVNFLSIMEKYRKSGLLKKLAKILEQQTNLKIGFYTTSYPLKTLPFCASNIKHLYLQNNTIQNPVYSSLKKMTKLDIPNVLRLQKKYKIYLELNEKILLDLLDSPIELYVSIDNIGNICGFVSFYKTIIKNKDVCNLYYYNLSSLDDFINLIKNNYPNYVEIRCINTGCDSDLSEFGFVKGTGILYYNFMFKTNGELSKFYGPQHINLLMF